MILIIQILMLFFMFFFFLPIPYFLRDFDLSILQSVGITM